MIDAKWLIIAAIICLILALFMPYPKISAENTSFSLNAVKTNEFEQIKKVWEEQKARYLNVELPKIEFEKLAIASLFGVGIIWGTDFFVRRFSDSVIKRIFKKNKNS